MSKIDWIRVCVLASVTTVTLALIFSVLGWHYVVLPVAIGSLLGNIIGQVMIRRFDK